MIVLKDFEEIGFKITWKLLYIGFRGSVEFGNQLTTSEIINYAINCFIKSEEKEVGALASEYLTSIDEIEKRLNKLASNEKTTYSLEFDKWLVVYILKKIPEEGIDYVQGLIKLSDMWSDLNFPENSPYVIQGENNNILPEEYYCAENYKLLLKKHKQWVEVKKKKIYSNQ